MRSTHRFHLPWKSNLTMWLCLGFCLLTLVLCNDSLAQCSRGGSGGGGPSSGSRSTLSMPSSSFASSSIQYPTPRSLSMNQSSMLSTVMQMSAEQKYALAAYHQLRMPARLARAEMNRAKRAKRIALAKARRESEREYDSTNSASDLAISSTNDAAAEQSAIQANPQSGKATLVSLKSF